MNLPCIAAIDKVFIWTQPYIPHRTTNLMQKQTKIFISTINRGSYYYWLDAVSKHFNRIGHKFAVNFKSSNLNLIQLNLFWPKKTIDKTGKKRLLYFHHNEDGFSGSVFDSFRIKWAIPQLSESFQWLLVCHFSSA